MKRLLLILLLAALAGNNLLSQIHEAATYFPLKPGNKWVYSWYSTQFGQSGRFSRQTGSTLIFNGHLYYQYDGNYQRIDSLTANRFYYNLNNGCPWSYGERMTDSLAAKLNDTIRYNCGANYKVCSDTNMRSLFGALRRTKNFRLGNNGLIYVKNFGIMEFYSQSGNIFYVENLIGCIIDGIVYGDTSLTGINQISSEVPEKFSLSQNYPNPFNPTTHFEFRIAHFGLVKITVYNAIGAEVQVLVNQQLSPGTYETDWDGSNFSSGLYFYILQTEGFNETKKMILIK